MVTSRSPQVPSLRLSLWSWPQNLVITIFAIISLDSPILNWTHPKPGGQRKREICLQWRPIVIPPAIRYFQCLFLQVAQTIRKRRRRRDSSKEMRDSLEDPPWLKEELMLPSLTCPVQVTLFMFPILYYHSILSFFFFLQFKPKKFHLIGLIFKLRIWNLVDIIYGQFCEFVYSLHIICNFGLGLMVLILGSERLNPASYWGLIYNAIPKIYMTWLSYFEDLNLTNGTLVT